MPHYSFAQHPEALCEAGEILAKGIVERVGDRPFILLYTGMSGIATATTIANELSRMGFDDFGMMYIRKKGEVAHGRKFECSKKTLLMFKDAIVVFVDDFISTGATLARCLGRYLYISERSSVDVMLAMSGEYFGQSRLPVEEIANSFEMFSIASNETLPTYLQFSVNVYEQPTVIPDCGD